LFSPVYHAQIIDFAACFLVIFKTREAASGAVFKAVSGHIQAQKRPRISQSFRSSNLVLLDYAKE